MPALKVTTWFEFSNTTDEVKAQHDALSHEKNRADFREMIAEVAKPLLGLIVENMKGEAERRAAREAARDILE